ncbi:MAG TPA: DciA family protein [Casimicrobiaceae bacterium]|nr:DciA family protein [Casimicrobiaceae bacterium]
MAPDPPRPPRARHQALSSVFQNDPTIAEWATRRRHEQRVTVLVRKCLPRSIGERVRVRDARGDVLEVLATAGAIAAAVRQRLPEVRAALAREGLAFHELRVRVDVASFPPGPETQRSQPWDARSAASLFDLGDRLPPGPLKEALRQWSRRARGR